MTARNGTTLAWDGENRLTGVGSGAATYVYDGDGNRIKKIENSQTTVDKALRGQLK